MELAMGAMASLAPKLGELLEQEYVLQKGLKPDIESLSRELVMMKAALVDASEVPPDQLSNVDKLWVRQVRELSYDMEDAVDDFMVRLADRDPAAEDDDDAANVIKKVSGKVTGVIKELNLIQKVKDRHQLANKIKDIKKLSKELAELRARYTVKGAGANLATSIDIDPRVLGLYKKESDLVGIQEARDRVIRMLTETGPAHASNQSLKIVSIVGVGGLGKTTLAKAVYDILNKDFDCSALFSVGRTPDVMRIFEKLLVELDEKCKQRDMAKWDLKQFCDELHTFLGKKRYFIVVDDIWDNKSWNIIRDFLKDNDCGGSRIIMTTRNRDVTTKEEEVYILKPLSDDNSKKLFYKRVQSQEGEGIDNISVEASSKIIDKCGGIPLAIIAMASLLVDKSCQDWSKVYDSIGFGKTDDITLSILSYSYYDLPLYLKPCMLYLSIFPEDDILDPHKLIWMWMAEGFVHIEQEGQRLFEVGERYFNELVNRSMIQMEKQHETFGLYKACRIHDIVLDLIRKLSIEENFVTIIGKENHTSLDNWRGEMQGSIPCSDSKARRLTVQNCHVKHIPRTMDRPEMLRSVCIISSDIESMASLCSFKACRVLYVYRSPVLVNPKHLEKLRHLKFLAIEGELVEEFSKEVAQLKSLQRLELSHYELEELPSGICSLTQLLCLKLKGALKSFPAGRDRMGNLASLEHLELDIVDGQSVAEAFVAELGKMTRLRVLVVKFYPGESEESLLKAFGQSLCSLQELQELDIDFSPRVIDFPGIPANVWEPWEPPRKLRHLHIDGIRFSRCPAWISSSRLPCLRFLDLSLHVVHMQDLDSLARFPELHHLNLGGLSWPPMYNTDGFKNLRTCAVKTLLKFDMGAMSRLEELHFWVSAAYLYYIISDDGSLVEQLFLKKDAIGDLDFGLGNLRSLEQVTIDVNCYSATLAQVQETEAAVRRAVEDHPNRPTLKMQRTWESGILSHQRYHEEVRRQHNMEIVVSVRKIKDDEADVGFICLLRDYLYLQRAIFSIDCAGARMCQVEKVETALRHAANVHHNRPTLQLIRINTEEMVSSSDHPNTEVDDHDNEPLFDFSKVQRL